MSVRESLANAWVTYPRPNPDAHLRLFCFPYAGGAASMFYPWLNDLPREVEVCPLQLPGRENRLGEPPLASMGSLLEILIPNIRPSLDKQFAFFGHSMGALIGFELIRQLRKHGEPQPVHLFVSGNHAPQLSNPDPPIHHLPHETFVEELRRFNGTPDAVLQNAELMELFLPILRADIALNETYIYTPREQLDCPISAFGGLEDKEVSYDSLAAWHEQTRGEFTLRMLPGDHFFLRNAHLQLMQAISQDLTRTLVQVVGGVL